MKMYVISLAAGILVGIIYGLLNVRSPAPPAIALIGLLGILLGEQVVPMVAKLIKREPITAAWVKQECIPKITGAEPKGRSVDIAQADKAE
jgi:XapX domain-containing protein